MTIALAVRGRFAGRDVPGYIAAQVVGGILAGLLTWATHGQAGVTAGLGGATSLDPANTILVGLVVEALTAFLLVLASYALVAEEQPSRGVAGLGVGSAYGNGHPRTRAADRSLGELRPDLRHGPVPGVGRLSARWSAAWWRCTSTTCSSPDGH